MIREFNFMIGQELHIKIENYRNENNISYNKAIFIIFNMMIPLLKKEHFTGNEKNSKYQLIKAVKRVHLYLEDEIYREIKLIHSNLNFYSMAILVRFLIEEFFKIYEKNQKDENVVKKEMEETEEEYNRPGVWWKLKVGQLFEPYLIISYNDKYNTQKIKLLT